MSLFRFLLFLLALTPVLGQQPLATKWNLPVELKSKAIWSIDSLEDGRLALGFEGGLAVGLPDERWVTIPSPMGSIVRGVKEGHGKTLVVGHGFLAFLEGSELRVLRAMDSPFNGVEVVPEGWLAASNREVWLIDPKGVMSTVFSVAPNLSNDTRVSRYQNEVIVSGNASVGFIPSYWREGKLVPAYDFSYYKDSVIAWTAGDEFLISRWGLMTKTGDLVLGRDSSQKMVRAGIVGLAGDGGNLLVGTLSNGLYCVDPQNSQVVWNVNVFGDIYCVRPFGDLILLGTSRGVYSLARPSRATFFDLEDKSVIGLLPSKGGVAVVTSGGTLELSSKGALLSPIDPDVYWYPFDGAVVGKSKEGVWAGKSVFAFGDQAVRLSTRFVNGVAHTGNVAACSQDTSVVVISALGPQIFPVTANSIAGVNGSFYIGTAASGVEVVSWSGPIRTIGEGRSYVRQLAEDRALLLFWDGHLFDTTLGPLGKVPFGNPRDAVLVGDRLHVLVSRAGGTPVVLTYEKGAWSTVDVLGLVEIGAERLTSVDGMFVVAGPGGVVFSPLPLQRTVRPTLEGFRMDALVRRGTIILEDGATSLGVKAPASFSPLVPSVYSVRIGSDPAVVLLRGVERRLDLPLGSTPLEVSIERNGLVVKESFVVVRPAPWWLGPWIIPIYFGVLAVLVFLLLQWRTQLLRQRNKELEDRVAMRTEELRKALATKEEFLASVSHEIRNPLNGVVGICGMLSDREVAPRDRILLKTLGGCADQLRWMLDDILNFTRTDTTLMESVFDACALVHESASMMDPGLKSCILKVPETPCWVKGDSGKVRQVLCNLISNALKYGVPHVAKVSLEVQPVDRGFVALRFLVGNRAPGFSEADMKHIFDPFWRGKNAGLLPGTGLGLPVCQRLAKAMRGTVHGRVYQEEVEFSLSIALKEETAPQATSVPLFLGGRVLGVEDEEYNQIVLDHLLKHLGFVVDWAKSGGEALKLAAENEYLLILTDWRLKDMDGGELCRALHARAQGKAPVVVAVTAYSSEAKRREAKECGFRGFVTKPVTVEKLERVLVELWGSKGPLVVGPVSAPRISKTAVAAEVAQRWEFILAASAKKAPDLAGLVHGLRSLVLTVHEEEAAEQLGVLEGAIERQDWASVHAVIPFVDEELQTALARMRS